MRTGNHVIPSCVKTRLRHGNAVAGASRACGSSSRHTLIGDGFEKQAPGRH